LRVAIAQVRAVANATQVLGLPFAEFAKLPIADPSTHTLALYCFSV
jgi:hypothetical protein